MSVPLDHAPINISPSRCCVGWSGVWSVSRLTLILLGSWLFNYGSSCFGQDLFRAPTMPSLRSIDDRAVSAVGRNRFGLSPHLTSANAVDLGVRQTNGKINFELNANSSTPSPQDGISGLETIDGIEAAANKGAQTVDGRSADDPRNVVPSPVGGREKIVQRYSDGKPQIEREVVQDANGNYVNDGTWLVLARQDERSIIASGEYRMGVMHGIWQRQHTSETSGLFATKPFSLFKGPFLSVATFDNGKLEGMWTLSDAYEQKMFEVPYRNGQRSGTATWWYPSLNKMREVTFSAGVLDGHLKEWDEDGKLTRDEEFIDGQKVVRNLTFYRPQQKESENYFLEAKLTTDGEDNWWAAQPAPLVSVGKRLQHGPALAWYDSGLPKMKGQFADGERVGRFTWWHSNGNKQLEGAYEKGQKVGRWNWWHENGMKAIEGSYEANLQVGDWRWWDIDGKLENQEQMSKPAAPDREPPMLDSEIELKGDSEKSTGAPSNPEIMPEAENESIVPLPPLEGAREPAQLESQDLEGIDPQATTSPTGGEANPASNDPGQLPDNFFIEK